MSTSDGSTADYYKLPAGATELQDLISHRNLNAQDGEIFRAIYRKGRASHSDELRDARKVLFYAQAEVKRLERLAATPTAIVTISDWKAGRADLVQKLASEGFALIGRAVDPVEDMSDWRNWKAGDLVEFVKESSAGFTKGKTYTIRGFRPLSSNQIDVVCDDEGDENGWKAEYFKFHSRPSA